MSRPRLGTLKAVRLQMSRLFWDAREGVVPVGDASRMAYLLHVLSGAIQAEISETRLSRLEALADEIDRTP